MDDGMRFHEGMGMAHSFPSYYWRVVFVPPFAAVGLFILWWPWPSPSPCEET